MVDRQQLITLIKASRSLSEKEKAHFHDIVPVIGEAHVAYFINVFRAEQKIWEQLPHVEKAIEQGLKDMFDQTVQGYDHYKKLTLEESESKQRTQQVSEAEHKLEEL